MTSVNNQITSGEDSFPRQSSPVEQKAISNSILNQHGSSNVADVIKNNRKQQTKWVVFRHFLVSLWYTRNTHVFLFALFTSIAMTISVLTVYFTSPKQAGRTCSFILRSEAHSLITDDSHPCSIAVGHFNNDSLLDVVVANSGTNEIGVFLRWANNTFINQMTYPTGLASVPYAVAVGDFDKDQREDIAVANFGTNNIGIFLGTGNGTFKSQTTFSTGSSRPQRIAVGDFNKDTALDIAVINYGTNNIGVLLGHGNGTFSRQITSSTGYDSLPISFVVNDFNNDGQLDIVVANYGTNNVGVLLGYGNGTFTIQTTFSTDINSHPFSIATGDFNKDTHLDIVVVNFESDTVTILLGYGNGRFTVSRKYSTGDYSFPHSVAVGDFDNDNQLDIVVANYGTPSVGILFGHGNGTFADQTAFFSSSNSNSYMIATGNFNNDSRMDIVIINYDNNYVDILLTYRNTSFSNQTTYTTTGLNSYPMSIAFADFNNDSQLDIVVANYWTNNVSIFVGYGNGTFSTQTTYSTGSNSGPSMVTVGDVNNDRRLDIVVANYWNNSVGILFGYGDRNFSSQTIYSTGNNSRPCALIIDDFNIDKRPDIVVANYWTDSVGIFIGYGNGTFSSQTTYSTGKGSRPLSVASGDLNNDGWPDIAVANYLSNNVGIFLGFGNGSFTEQRTYSTGIASGPSSVVFGDLNGDNLLDIVVTNFIANNVGVFLGYGTGNFSSQGTFSTGNGSSPKSIAITDINNDSQLDIVVVNYNANNVGIFLGYGNGSFSSQKGYLTGIDSRPHAVAVSDLNNDDRPDIAVVNYGTSNVAILLRYGDSFESPKIYSTKGPSTPYSVAVGDFNADGQLDMVATNFNSDSIDVFFGYGDGNFSSQTTYSTGIKSNPFDVAIGDFNNDSRLDIVVANNNIDCIGVFLGYGNGTFSNQTTYFTGTYSYPQAVAVGDFNNDTQLDIAVINYSLNNFGIFFGYGNGNFSNQATFPTGNGSNPFDIALGDFNSDRRLDVTVINRYTYTVGIFLGYGNGNFSSQTTYTTGSSSAPCAVTVSDLNNDTQLDIIVGICYTRVIGILLGYGNGTFSSLTTYSTGTNSWPNSIVTGDWNNDNQMDIAVANRDTDNIGIFLGYGDGTFFSQTTYSTGTNSHPTSIASGDFNGDSLLDIMVTNSNTNTVGVFLGLTFISGERENTYSTGSSSHPRSVALGDFNNDALVDIAVANYGLGDVGVLFGYANRTFFIQTRLDTGSLSFPTSIAVDYLDNNSALDIAIANSGTENIGVFYGYGNGSFSNLTTYSTGIGSIPQSIAIGDFNNDKRLDIAVASDGIPSVNVLLRYDSGAFRSQIVYATGTDSSPFGVAVGDFNNDGWLDFAVANKATDNVGVFLALRNGTFSSQVMYSTGSGSSPWGLAVGDFNNDSHLDIVVTNYWTYNIGILLGYGNGTFMRQTTYPIGNFSYPRSVVVADFNNDKQLDIVVTNYRTHNISIFLGCGNGIFSSQITYSTGSGSYPTSVAIGDFNNDRQYDIVITNSELDNVGIFLGYGNGTFSSQVTYSTGDHSNPYAVAVGDFNNDSLHDIVVANYIANTIGVLFGYGNGTFSSQTSYSTGSGSGPRGVRVGDFNNDKQQDIAVVNFNNDKLSILLGCTNGTFFSQLTYSTGAYSLAQGLAVGDFNRDGRLDIIITKYGTNNVGLFLGYASESFLSAPSYSTGFSYHPTCIAIGDFDNNTQLDIVVASNNTDNIIVVFGSGYGTFLRAMTYSTGNGSRPRWAAVADFNNDSCLDIVVANSGSDNVGVFLGNGNGTFSSQTTYFTGLRSQPYSVVVLDIDKDARLDIVVANYGSNSVGVFLGCGNGSFASQLIFNAGFDSHPSALVVGDVNKDNLTDVVITNDGYGNIDILSKVC